MNAESKMGLSARADSMPKVAVDEPRGYPYKYRLAALWSDRSGEYVTTGTASHDRAAILDQVKQAFDNGALDVWIERSRWQREEF